MNVIRKCSRECFQILYNKINVSSVIYLKKGNAFDLQRFTLWRRKRQFPAEKV